MIINFTLDKIYIEKLKEVKGPIEANNNIKFLEVFEAPLPDGVVDQTLIKFKFEYKVNYTPAIAKTDIQGCIHYLTSKKERDAILKQWDKEAKIDRTLSAQFVNYIFTRCGVKALSLSQELNLPSHIPLPRIGLKKKEAPKKESKPKAS